jgi:hypothetical protein
MIGVNTISTFEISEVPIWGWRLTDATLMPPRRSILRREDSHDSRDKQKKGRGTNYVSLCYIAMLHLSSGLPAPPF